MTTKLHQNDLYMYLCHGTCTMEIFKKDGTSRTMRATLSPIILSELLGVDYDSKTKTTKKSLSSRNSKFTVVYDLNSKGWRSVDLNTAHYIRHDYVGDMDVQDEQVEFDDSPIRGNTLVAKIAAFEFGIFTDIDPHSFVMVIMFQTKDDGLYRDVLYLGKMGKIENALTKYRAIHGYGNITIDDLIGVYVKIQLDDPGSMSNIIYDWYFFEEVMF